MKKLLILGLVGLITTTSMACTTTATEVQAETIPAVSDSQEISVDTVETTQSTTAESNDEVIEVVTDTTMDKTYPGEEASVDTAIKLNETTASITGEGATVSDQLITISKAGVYELTGTFNGQILVDAGDDDIIQLVFNSINITNTLSAPIYIKNAEDVIITLKSSTNNTLVDQSQYIKETDDETIERINGAIYAKDDLIINGNGSLTINAKEHSAILGKDDVYLLSGTLNLTADRNGVKGKDSVYVGDVVLSIDAKTDGLDSDTLVSINGGQLNINSSEDALHSDTNLYINAGQIMLSAGDDGIHADELLEINDGNITITNSYEGLESKNLYLNGGHIDVTSSDDAVNATDGTTSGFMGRGKPPKTGEMPSFDFGLFINGGTITLNASGDGLDSNGFIEMTGGTVYVSGPTSNQNGSLDYDGTFVITGGEIITTGSAGMFKSVSTDSTLNTISLGLDTMNTAGTLIEVKDDAGNTLFSQVSPKAFETLLYASENLIIGKTYHIEINGENYLTYEQTQQHVLSNIQVRTRR